MFNFFSGGNGYYNSPSNTAATGVATQGNNGGIAYNNGWPFLAGGGGGAAGAGGAGTSSRAFFSDQKLYTTTLRISSIYILLLL